MAQTMSRTNSSYGLSDATASRIQPWKANVPVARSGWSRRFTRSTSAHLLAKK